MKKVLVTGGGGFLGGALIERLLETPGLEIASFSRGDYPALARKGVRVLRGDLSSADDVLAACDGCDTVFHVAAKAGVWGAYEEYYRANVVGTRNVLTACRRCFVKRLVFTSSPSVVFDGSDMEGVDESVPYPESYESAYPETKAEAEKMVLKANSPGLATVALRPHLIWGPGDRHLVPRIISRAEQGLLRVVGDGCNKVDTVYIDNAALAHVKAALTLEEDAAACAGKAYFISQGDPRPLWDVVNDILEAASLSPVTKRVPAWLAYAVGWALETVYKVLGRQEEPGMTRFVARELATSHWFDISAAERDLGYEPLVSYEEGMNRLRAWLDVRRKSSGD